MKKILAGLAAALCLALSAGAQEKKTEEPRTPQMSPPMQAMMEAYARGAAVGQEHEFLARLEGTWVCTLQSYMAPGEPEVSYGLSEYRMVLGGRFLLQTFRGTAMGQPFEGMGLTGFDNVQKKVVGFWVDSMGTGFMTSEGSVDLEKGTLSTRSTHVSPLTGRPEVSREELAFENPDAFTFRMYGKDPQGREVLQVETAYHRLPPKEPCKK